jgi:Zn-dependent peptidase ImmA (M78 family)
METLHISIPNMVWAANRAGISEQRLVKKFPQWHLWLSGDTLPTVKQLLHFAKMTYLPVTDFLDDNPPDVSMPIPDFRTIQNNEPRAPSVALLETLDISRSRQAWFREYLESEGADPLDFVGSAFIDNDTHLVAKNIHNELGFTSFEQENIHNPETALNKLIALSDDIGILVMRGPVAGFNSNLKLDPREFSGFAITDDLAPLIFINSSDDKYSQIFTLVHELAHIWLGETGICRPNPLTSDHNDIENWCNAVAMEFLVPEDALLPLRNTDNDLDESLETLSNLFHVSEVVILRRLLDIGVINKNFFSEECRKIVPTHKNIKKQLGIGDNFFATMQSRLGHRFVFAVTASAFALETTLKDALYLLSLRKVSTFIAYP